MKKIVIVGLGLMLISTSVFAAAGPTGVKNVNIGMSKASYLEALGIQPINCNTYVDEDGESKMYSMESLRPDEKRLCRGYSGSAFNKNGIIESIRVNNISYDVITANSEASSFFNKLGYKGEAIFLADRLISLEISQPKVSVEILTGKYGVPKLVDNMKVKTCQNRGGNKFKNNVGSADVVWENKKVKAIFRVKTIGPIETCTDIFSFSSYILEESESVRIIERAILKYHAALKKKAAEASPF